MSLEAATIRLAGPHDVPGILACERRPGYEDTVGRWTAEEHGAALRDPTHRHFILAGPREEVLGFLMLQEIGAPSGSILIRRVAVMEQGRGYGRRLLEHALRHIFLELGAERAYLHVWPHNARGVALYKSVGMREDGRRHMERDGQPAYMHVLAITAEAYRARQERK